jgi:DNA polymerase-3 subunit epsilon
MDKKILFIDTETTGKLPEIHGIHQLAGIVEINGIVREEFDIRVKPHPICIINDHALEVSGVTREQVMAYGPADVGFLKFFDIVSRHIDVSDPTDRFYACGYNAARFDIPFAEKFITQNSTFDYRSIFRSAPLEVMSFVAQYCMNNDIFISSFAMGRVAKTLGIPIITSSLHEGLYDIRLTREIYEIVRPK